MQNPDERMKKAISFALGLINLLGQGCSSAYVRSDDKEIAAIEEDFNSSEGKKFVDESLFGFGVSQTQISLREKIIYEMEKGTSISQILEKYISIR